MPPIPRDSGHIRCICGDDDDDGFTIQCERCLVWQHAKCVGVGRSSVPERYFCERCGPIDISSFVGTGMGNGGDRLDSNSFASTSTLTSTLTGTPLNPSTPTAIPTPPGVPFCNEIAENIISPEAKEQLQQQLKSINFPALLRRQRLLQCTSPANFEFTSLPCFDSCEPPANRPGLEVKEIRSRGYQKKGMSTRYGLFTQQACDPGHFIAEFVGHLQTRDSIVIKKEKNGNSPLHVTQSLVLFLPNNLAIDARKFGSPVRYVRRSCRPNVQVKQFLCAGGRVGWGLFAKNIICANSELLLPLDYSLMGGRVQFRYDCACNTPEFCLGPPGEAPATTTSTVNSGLMRSSSPLLMEEAAAVAGIVGVRRSSSVVHLNPNVNEEPTLPQRPILDTRKLSREERKLQQYIEYFERMDSAAETTKQRSTSSISGSRSRASTSPKSGAASTGKTASPKSKKSWKTLFEEEVVDGADGLEGVDDTVEGVESVEGVEGVESVENVDISFEDSSTMTTTMATNSAQPVTKGKRGRKPGSKNKPKVDEIPSIDDLPAAASTQSKSSSPVKRKNSPELAIVDEDLDIGGEGTVTQEVIRPKKIKTVKTAEGVAISATFSSTASATTPSSTASATTPSSTASTTGLPSSHQSHPSQLSEPAQPSHQPQQPDTPTKKKLSLSDYLKKRKASPQESSLNDFPANAVETGMGESLLAEPVIVTSMTTMERSKSVQELRDAIFGESSMNSFNAETTSGRSSVISSETASSQDKNEQADDSYDRERDREKERGLYDRAERERTERDRDPYERIDRYEREPYERTDRHERDSLERTDYYSHDHSSHPHAEAREPSPFERRSIDYSYERQAQRSYRPMDRSVEYSSYDHRFDRGNASSFDRDYSSDRQDREYASDRGDRDYSSSAYSSHSSYDHRQPEQRSFNDHHHRPYSRPPIRPAFAPRQRDSRDYQPRPPQPHHRHNHHHQYQGRPPFRPHRGGYNNGQGQGNGNGNGLNGNGNGQSGNSGYRPPKRDYRPPYNNNDYSR